MNPFKPELDELVKERDRLLNMLMTASPPDRPSIKTEFDRVHARIGELIKLQHDWMIGALDAVIDRLEEIVREERRRMSSISAPIETLVDRLAQQDTASALPPGTRIPGATAPATTGSRSEAAATTPARTRGAARGPDSRPAARNVPASTPARSGTFDRAALADLAETEARRELVLGRDQEAEQYVRAFRDALSGWQTMPWCAAFVHWCCNKLGANLPVFVPGLPDGALPGVPNPTYAYNVAWKVWAQQNQWFHARNGFGPQRGDLVVFDWNADGRNDHIGVVLGLAEGGLITAEGNTRNSHGDRASGALKRRTMNPVDGFIRLPEGMRL